MLFKLYILILSLHLSFCLCNDNSILNTNTTLSSRKRLLSSTSQEDSLEIIEVASTTSNIYESLQIIESTAEEILGDHYVSFDPNMFEVSTVPPKPSKKRKKHRSKLHRRRREMDPTLPPTIVVPVKDRWNETIAYHHSHTSITDEELSQRKTLVEQFGRDQDSIVISNKTQYLIYWPPKAGIGNTLIGLCDVLLLAMYTKLFGWDCILQFISFPFTNVIFKSKKWLQRKDALILGNTNGCHIDLASIIDGSDKHQYIAIRESCGIERKFLHHRQLKEWFIKNGILSLSSCNPAINYHRILQFLLVDVLYPLPEITSEVTHFEKLTDWDHYYHIGMHIRSGLLEGNIGWGQFLEPNDVDYFIKLAEKSTESVKKYHPGIKIKWLVLSDNEAVKRKVKKAAGSMYLTTNCTVQHSKDSNLNGLKWSLIENYILSDCSTLILTEKSTFGYLAKHRTDVPQLNVKRGAWKKHM